MIRQIVQKGAPILRHKATDIDFKIEKDALLDLAKDITDTINDLLGKHSFTKGIGLAAPQIGVSKRVFGFMPPQGHITIYVNPEIIEKSEATDFQYEGCLSFFDVRGQVERALNLTLKYFDLEGSCHEHVFTFGDARIIQHEIDHISGTLYSDKMTPDGALVPYGEYIKMKESAWRY